MLRHSEKPRCFTPQTERTTTYAYQQQFAFRGKHHRAKTRTNRLLLYSGNTLITDLRVTSRIKQINKNPLQKDVRIINAVITWSSSAGDWPVQENRPIGKAGKQRALGVFRKLPARPVMTHARRSNASANRRRLSTKNSRN